jgi:hypothetical protein
LVAAGFISYKRENLDRVRPLVEGLRREGLSVWWDQDIPPDAPWEATIERELEAANVVIVAWSIASVASENVKAEARRARNHGKLIQIFVEPCEPPLFFGERQGVDLSNWSGSTTDTRFRTIVEAVQAILNGKRPPTGVGFKARRRAPWRALATSVTVGAGVLGFVANLGGARDFACDFESLAAICATLAPVSPVRTEGREELLRAVTGTWGVQGENCSETVRYEWLVEPPNPPLLITTRRDGSAVREQLLTADNGRVMTQEISPRLDGSRLIWTYAPNGQFMLASSSASDAPNPAPLVRCESPQ